MEGPGEGGAARGAPRPALEGISLTKSFGPLQALKGVSLSFDSGEIHAVLGANGAGKSTLMNIFAGYLAPDSGVLLRDGQPIDIGRPSDALRHGIGMVHQHVRLVERFTVAENIGLGSSTTERIVDRKKLGERADELADSVGLGINVNARVAELSAGERQRVEILRVLHRGVSVLILDEPTAVLTPIEADQLGNALRGLADKGGTIIYVSHKLAEVKALANRISVMRDGELIETLEAGATSERMLARMVMGETPDAEQPSGSKSGVRPQSAEGSGITLKGIRKARDSGESPLKIDHLDVEPGELYAIVGVAGNGQRELEEIVTGMSLPDRGSVSMNGRAVSTVRECLDTGLAYIPDDRLGMALMPRESLWRNGSLRVYRDSAVNSSPVWLSRRRLREYVKGIVQSVGLSTDDVTVLAGQLSGGNAQKLVAGRELGRPGNRTVVAVNPTQGLDVGAAQALRRRLIEARDSGMAVLLISADLDEALSMADRISVLFDGELIGGTIETGHLDRDHIGALMGGVRLHRDNSEGRGG